MSNKVKLLASAGDRESLAPILAALGQRGIRAAENPGTIGKNDTVLAVLSERFYADEGLTGRLLSLVGSEAENILPLQLDDEPIPDALKNALYSRNIIPAAGRDAPLIAERIAAALPQKRSRLPVILGAAALVLVAAVGLLVWKSRAPTAVETIAPTAEPTAVPLNLPLGLTAEDLEKIVDVIIVGDRAEFFTTDRLRSFSGTAPDWDYFAYRDYDNAGAHFYSREDGHEYPLTRYEDLSFLALMPKLRYLHLAMVETGKLPDLSGAATLSNVSLMDCVIPDLDWLGGAGVIHADIINSTGSLRDFSPLTKCKRLRECHIDLIGTRQADLAGFAPPKLTWLWINNGQDLQGDLDLSGLAGCGELHQVQLEYNLPVRDLSFLSGADKLERLELTDLHALRDISALSGLRKLTELKIDDCSSLRNYRPVGDCKALEQLMIYAGWNVHLEDASFLSDLPRLTDISLYSVDLPDLDFLRVIGQRQSSLNNFSFSGDVRDCSALAAIKKYSSLSLEPYNGDLAPILPYLAESSVTTLSIRFANAVDLSALSIVSNRLILEQCGITDLSTASEDLSFFHLTLSNCSRLSSLEGLQKLTRLGSNGVGTIEIYNCPRLTDWSAIDGMTLMELNITGGYTLPSFADLRVGLLRIDSVADVKDLTFLSEMDASRSVSFRLVGLDEVNDLTPLRQFHGLVLAVPPQLGEQAQDLVRAGNFKQFEIEYPQGGWEMDRQELTLLSLEELNTLPEAMLRRVSSVALAGDQVIDRDRFEIWEDYQNNRAIPILYDRETDTQTEVSLGSFTDLTELFKMTGLRQLRVASQPITGLDGIQELSGLDQIELKCCPKLTDISPLFAMQSLSEVCLRGCPGVTSIQGIQNLPHLIHLEIVRVPVSDLSPLTECDLSAAEERGGFWLELDDNPVQDFSPLAGIPRFSNLCLNNIDCKLWLPYLREAQIDHFSSCNCRMSNEELAEFAAEHPELREIDIPWNQQLTDLTPLLSLENLERVQVSRNMEKAVATLEGQGSFRLEING